MLPINEHPNGAFLTILDDLKAWLRLYANAKPSQPSVVRLEEVKNYIGKTVTVTGKVFSSRDIGSMTLVNLGAAYPNQLLTIDRDFLKCIIVEVSSYTFSPV